MEDNRLYFHKLDVEEHASLMSKEPSIEYIMENYKQPEWCTLTDALNPLFGCEDLTGENRVDISKRGICRDCPYCKRKLGVFGL